MKILFVQDSLGTGGAERSNAYLWYYLRERGVEFRIVVLGHRKEGIEKEILSEGFNVTFLERGNFLKNGRDIADVIREFNPSVVHSVLYESNMRVRFAKLFADFYHVESLVNCTYAPIRFKDPRVSKPGLYLAKYMDFFSRSRGVDHSIAITREVAKHYQEQFNIPSSQMSVIFRGRKENPHLADRIAIREKLITELGIAADKVLLIHVGRQEYQKGHVHLLEALHILHERNREVWDKISILFCGRMGNASADIDDFTEAHPYLNKHMQWLGHRHDVPQLLAASDVFVFPSLYEGLGGSLIEAQAAALPVVCSDIPVLHEVVNAGDNALMFPVTDAQAMAKQIEKVVCNAELQKRMRERSLINYQEKFRLDNINEEMLNFYRKVSKQAVES
ncbi:glycosyltransferase family 4 protein [Cesiribacter sp. SM1]|uniref:glycosyltransferase family 4 protein n=1 Tax=Cesiribacter sp. SM1 TaxID=2861196 RepID=UPI001CD7D902|nr:glycosyltransferase family 4 protein [Cesiribacter sp. SM1]